MCRQTLMDCITSTDLATSRQSSLVVNYNFSFVIALQTGAITRKMTRTYFGIQLIDSPLPHHCHFRIALANR
jgi:hypothetical protein